jgi:Ca-activated chloride channel family protein
VILWGDLQLAQPWWLLLVLVAPVGWWWRRRRRVLAVPYARVDLLAQSGARRSWWRRIRVAVHLMALVAATIALARPQSGASAEAARSEGIDIVLVLDLSSSMLAEDFQPRNRLEVAKERLKDFIAARRDDRIGLVAFAGEALTQVPLTLDYPVLLAAVDNLQAGVLVDGTAIGTAIATGANRLRDVEGRSRVMVLLTDGESNRGTIDPRTAAAAAADFGIRVYTIGVGSEGTAPVPVARGVFGLRYENRPVRIDESLLEDVASATGGRYFRARDAAALEQVYEQIDQLERSPVRAPRYRPYVEEYRWPLAVALVLVAFDLLVLAWRRPLP